jgi:hypothetical protein
MAPFGRGRERPKLQGLCLAHSSWQGAPPHGPSVPDEWYLTSLGSFCKWYPLTGFLPSWVICMWSPLTDLPSCVVCCRVTVQLQTERLAQEQTAREMESLKQQMAAQQAEIEALRAEQVPQRPPFGGLFGSSHGGPSRPLRNPAVSPAYNGTGTTSFGSPDPRVRYPGGDNRQVVPSGGPSTVHHPIFPPPFSQPERGGGFIPPVFVHANHMAGGLMRSSAAFTAFCRTATTDLAFVAAAAEAFDLFAMVKGDVVSPKFLLRPSVGREKELGSALKSHTTLTSKVYLREVEDLPLMRQYAHLYLVLLQIHPEAGVADVASESWPQAALIMAVSAWIQHLDRLTQLLRRKRLERDYSSQLAVAQALVQLFEVTIRHVYQTGGDTSLCTSLVAAAADTGWPYGNDLPVAIWGSGREVTIEPSGSRGRSRSPRRGRDVTIESSGSRGRSRSPRRDHYSRRSSRDRSRSTSSSRSADSPARGRGSSKPDRPSEPRKHDSCFQYNTVDGCKRADCAYSDVHGRCRVCKESGHIMWNCRDKVKLRSMVQNMMRAETDPLTLKKAAANKYPSAEAAIKAAQDQQ